MPIYLIFVLVMLIMAFASFNYNKILFFIEVALSLVALAVVLAMTIDFKQYVRKVVHDVLKNVDDVSQERINSVKTPVCVVAENLEILFYNSLFKTSVLNGAEAYNENISEYLGDTTLKELTESTGTVDINLNDRSFTVYTTSVDKGVMLTFIDNTYYKNIEREFNETKKSVALAIIDSVDESMSDGDEETTQLMNTVESLLSRWSKKHDSLFRKLDDRKYLIIFDEKTLNIQVEKKFRILDKIRQLSVGDKATTISVGIGRNCRTLQESHKNAKKALDMALGRGGDQIAILCDGEYEFFGGVSKGVEKTSKVRVRLIAQAVKNAIENCDKVLIMGHSYSDLDCVGAASGIYSIAKNSLSKRAYIVMDTEKSMAKSMIEHLSEKGSDLFVSVDRALSMVTDNTLLFIVDTHSPDFLESTKLYKNCKKVIVIDHHRKMVNYIDNADVFFHEPTASSTSEMVTELVSYVGDDGLTKVQSEALLGGIMLDTKNFVVNTGVRTFEAAAYLRKKGADTIIVRNMFSNSIETYKEKYKLVSESQIVDNCAISTIKEIVKNSRLISAQAADEMLTIKNVYASFVIAQLDSKTVNISARSYGKINVQLIMEKLGGGGHQNMAAAQLGDTTVEKTKEKLISIIRLS